MNANRISVPLFSAVLVLLVAAAPTFAKEHKQVKPEELTCSEFLTLDEEVQPSVVYYLHGKSGKVEAIAVDDYETPVTYVVDECQNDKTGTVWGKVKQWFENHK